MQTLRWVEHKSDILKNVAEFYRNEIYTDCTFLVEGQYLRGHKTILCACSPFFQELFERENGNKTISLKNVKFSDLKSIFQYIYFGVVDIPFSQVTSFLNTSNLLVIGGLEEFFNAESSGRQEETADTNPTSAFVNVNPLNMKFEEQEYENEETLSHINISEEEFIIPDDRERGSDIVKNADSLSSVDIKNEKMMDIDEESALPVHNIDLQMIKMENTEYFSSLVKEEPATAVCQNSPVVDSNSTNTEYDMLEEDNTGEGNQTTHCVHEEKLCNTENKEDNIDINDDAVFNSEVNVKSENPDEASIFLGINRGQQSKSDEETGAVPSKRNLKPRLRSSNRSHACNICSATFIKRGNLVAHQRKHTGERPFTCNQCPASFTQKGHLVRHLRKHTGEKPFTCNECSAAFAVKAKLIGHQWKHTGVRPYSCNECVATFTQKEYLVYHMRVHTGERPYACNNCSATFITSAKLVWHQRKQTCKQP